MLMLGLKWSRYKCRMHVKRQKTILYEQKHLKNDDKPVTWRKRYGVDMVLVLKIMNYREKPT